MEREASGNSLTESSVCNPQAIRQLGDQDTVNSKKQVAQSHSSIDVYIRDSDTLATIRSA